MDRIEYLNLYDLFNAKVAKQSSLIRRVVNIQKKIGWKRSISNKIPKLYGGSTYWSLSRECLKYVINYTNVNRFVLNRFKYTLCAEEFYFQTVIMNSKFATKVTNNNARYIDWNARNGNNPAVLDESDFKKLIESEAFFARKFDYPTSTIVMKSLKKHVLE